MILPTCLLLLHLALVATQVSWENCPGEPSNLSLLNVTITPYPIVAPGSAHVQISLHADGDIEGPLKATLSLKKTMLFGSVYVPCISGIGSCTYDDVCSLCGQCGCPFKAGDHEINMPIYIDTDTWVLLGIYQVQVNLESKSGQKGCVQLHSIHIKSTS